MFSLGSSHRYYLYNGHCDMRKSFDGLCGLVSSGLGRGATGGDVFVFLNRRRTHMKLLHWEHGGFVLYYKRLEGGTFPLPKDSSSSGEIDWSELVSITEVTGPAISVIAGQRFRESLGQKKWGHFGGHWAKPAAI